MSDIKVTRFLKWKRGVFLVQWSKSNWNLTYVIIYDFFKRRQYIFACFCIIV